MAIPFRTDRTVRVLYKTERETATKLNSMDTVTGGSGCPSGNHLGADEGNGMEW